ncbi:MAG: tetratricopeptide repeat protein [Planctomycetes bacterium]|nr:tetratricopeptide repeat protein [Planctomycetota bacterium]
MRTVLLVLLGVGALVGVLVWVGGHWLGREAPPAPPEGQAVPAPPDPRVTYTGPFLNVRPEVQYVGDARCAKCHPIETDGFHRHPMGRSLLPVADLVGKLRYDEEVRNPFEALQLRFLVQREGDRLWNTQQRLDAEGNVLAAQRSEVDYVIGSGQRGHSFFTVQDGFLFQTPISWYSQKQIWDLSPGFDDAQLRPVVGECVFCHSGGALPVENTENRYQAKVFTSPAISCERCHGPGELHVKFRAADKLPKGRIDHTIVNPHHLEPPLREAVCQQCHLEGEARVVRRGRKLFDYRPGLALSDFWAIYVAAEEMQDEHKAVGHVEQMYQSKCFKASKGKLGCATCHDPHGPLAPAERVPVYRKTCLHCHEQQHPCTEDLAKRKQQNSDSCIDCHMKRLRKTDIVHTATTDHRILRKPADDSPPLPAPFLLSSPLVPFPKRRARDEEAQRDEGLALARVAQGKRAYQRYLPRAEELLEKASARDPGDLRAASQLVSVLGQSKQYAKALAVAEKLLAIAPQHEVTLRLAAQAATELGKLDEALALWDRLLAVNPRFPEGLFFQAVLLARTGRHKQSVEACRRLLALTPTRAEPWVILAHCYVKLGETARAGEARRMAEALKTPRSEEFRTSFLRSAP